LHENWNNFNDFCVTKSIASLGAVSVDLKQKLCKSESWLNRKPTLLQIFLVRVREKREGGDRLRLTSLRRS